MQNRSAFGKHQSSLLHPSTEPSITSLTKTWEGVLQRNPAIKQHLRPEYQHNYFDPPHDIETVFFLESLNNMSSSKRFAALRKFLPRELRQWKAYISHLPIAQIQQLREQIYIARIGDLGSNSPCRYSNQHWVYRLIQNSEQIISASALRSMPFGERLRWYETAIQNVLTDGAEEEYLRYRNCLRGRMLFVEHPTIYNQAHDNPADGHFISMSHIPSPACRSLMGLVHDSHRHFASKISQECATHSKQFYQDLVRDGNLDAALQSFDGMQRCALGRELRARYMTNPPVMGRAVEFVGRRVASHWLPSWIVNVVDVRDNPVVQFSEVDETASLLALATGSTPTSEAAKKLQPLLQELQLELVQEGRLSPLPGQEHLAPVYVQRQLANQTQTDTSSNWFSRIFSNWLGSSTTTTQDYNIPLQPLDSINYIQQSDDTDDKTIDLMTQMARIADPSNQNISNTSISNPSLAYISNSFTPPKGSTLSMRSENDTPTLAAAALAADGSLFQHNYIDQEFASAADLQALAAKYELHMDQPQSGYQQYPPDLGLENRS